MSVFGLLDGVSIPATLELCDNSLRRAFSCTAWKVAVRSATPRAIRAMSSLFLYPCPQHTRSVCLFRRSGPFHQFPQLNC